MPEHTRPAALVEHLRNFRDGKAVLVAGAGLDVPPWSDALARLTAELAEYHIAVVALGPERREAPIAEVPVERPAAGLREGPVEGPAAEPGEGPVEGPAEEPGEVPGVNAEAGAAVPAEQLAQGPVAGPAAGPAAVIDWLEALRDAFRAAEPVRPDARPGAQPDAEDLEAALGLASSLVREAQAADAGTAAATWREVDRRYREILARHTTTMSEGQVTEIWVRLGLAARTLGDPRAAEAAYRRVVEREPLHEAALQALIELAGARGQWRTVAEIKRTEIDALAHVADSGGRRAKLYEQIGDLWHDRLGDVGSAIAAYLHGLALTPAARGLLHKLLEAFTAQRQWRRAIEMLERLSAEEASPERRARFHYAAALIARDELDDGSLAVDKLTAALDDAPLTAGAFDALDDLLAERGDWKQLARAYRRQLARLGDATPEALRELWARLGDVCLDHLADREAATEAYQVACELAPGDLVRRERLAELYLAAGDARRRDAIAELQVLLGHAPDRVELYKALASLYLAEHELDKAWCVAQVLVLLGAAGDDERRLYARFRSAALPSAPRRLTEELWQKAIVHPGEDRRVGAIFAAVGGVLAAGAAQPAAAFGLAPEARVDLGHDRRMISQIVTYASGVLALDPAPMLWLDDADDALRIANTLGLGVDRPRLVPSLLVGTARLGNTSERALAFEVGKRLAYLRPDRFVALAVATLPRLETAFAAAVLAGGGLSGEASDDARKLAAVLRAKVAGPVLEQIGAWSAGLADPTGDGRVAGWRAATDLTGNRAGFIVADDLEAAARAIATEGATLSGLTVKDRLRDLLGYAASEAYFAVRRHLGLDVRNGEPPEHPGGGAQTDEP